MELKLVYLLPLLLTPFFLSDSFAERGFDYNRIDNGDGTFTWTGGLDPWVFDDTTGQYVPFLTESDANFITLHSKQHPFKFDKNDCSLAIYDNIENKINQNSNLIVSKEYWSVAVSQLGSGTWTDLNALSIPCTFETSNSNGDLSLIVTRTAAQGELIVNYTIPMNDPLKISASFENTNPSWDNHKFRFIEKFIDFNVDELEYENDSGIQKINNILSQDRSDFINYDDIPDKAISLVKTNLTPFAINVASSYDDFQGITVDVVSGQLDLGFVYGRGQNFLLPGDIMSIDPTFGWSSSNELKIVTNNASGVSCPSSSYSKDTANTVARLAPSGSVGACQRGVPYWDITSIPDSATIDDVSVRWGVNIFTSARNCDWWSIENNPSTASASTLWTDIEDTTEYHDNDAACKSTNQTLDLGSSADSDLETELGVDNEWGVGIKFENEARNANTHRITFVDLELQVTYTTTGDPNTDIQQNGGWIF